MARLITLLLHTGLITSSIAAILFTVRMILQQALNLGSWYWAGAVAAFLGPVAFALALWLFNRSARPAGSAANA